MSIPTDSSDSSSLSKSAQAVQNALQSRGLAFEVKELASSTRTAQDAANTLGCEVAQIVKSLLFRTQADQTPILILASGINRVNEKLVATQIGEPIEKADADFAREVTGFAIGGIPPTGHKNDLKTYIDADLLKLGSLWAAAGTPNAVFSLRSSDLVILTQGKVIAIQ